MSAPSAATAQHCARSRTRWARVSLLVVVMAPGAGATDPGDGLRRALDGLRLAAGDRLQVSMHPVTGVAGFVRGLDSLPTRSTATPVEQADGFLQAYGAVFGIDDPATELHLVGWRRDAYGLAHVDYEQRHAGIPVFAAVLRVHLRADGSLLAVNGVFVPGIRSPPVPGLAGPVAARRARLDVAARHRLGADREDLVAGDPQLTYYHQGLTLGRSGTTRLVWLVEVRSRTRPIREWVFLDARDGKVVDRINRVRDALHRQVAQAVTTNVVWSDANGDPDPIPLDWPPGSGTPAVTVQDWQDEIDGSRETYNLFGSVTAGQFLSWDGASALMSTLHAPLTMQCPNASWDGTRTLYCPGVTSDDVVGHEWAHAYTETLNGLIYRGQAGALDEALADLWGESLDLLNGRSTDLPDALRSSDTCSSNPAGSNLPGQPTVDTVRWLLGEDSDAFGGAIRDLWNPRCFGNPGKVSDSEYACESGDGYGVHTNSGIPQRLFALLVDGASVSATTVSPLGLVKAAHLHWESQSMLTPTSTFADHADALEAACQGLLGVPLTPLSTSGVETTPGGEAIGAADCDEVADAISIVELREPPPSCVFEPILDPNPPPLCEGTEVDQTVADWELGLGGWTAGTREVIQVGTFDTPDWAVVSNLPGARSGSAAFVADLDSGDCATDLEAGVLYLESPSFVAAADAPQRLAFEHWFSTEDLIDGGNVKISVNGGAWQLVPGTAFLFNPYNATLSTTPLSDNPIKGEEAFTGADPGYAHGSWGQSQVDLAGFAGPGDSFALRFEMGIDSCTGYVGWYVDDVRVFGCSPCGNGVLDEGEECDDDNGDDGDGCSSLCAVEPEWICTEPSPATPGNDLLLDSGFEEETHDVWTQQSIQFGTPICGAGCAPPPNVQPGASAGEGFLWFGRIDDGDDASVEQLVVIPPGATTLTWDVKAASCDSSFDFVELRIDGNVLDRVDGGSAGCGATSHSTRTVDVSAWGDDGTHAVGVYSHTEGFNSRPSDLFVDELRLDDGSGTPPRPSLCSWLIFADGFETGDVSAWAPP